MNDLCIKNGLIVTENEVIPGTVYIKDGIIVKISQNENMENSQKTIDAKRRYVMPGFVDPHAHLNDPGLTESEDFYTGTCSAAAGGITTVLEHPLTFPLPKNIKSLREKEEIASKKAIVDYALFGACAPGNLKDLEEMSDFGAVAFKAFMPYSSEIPQLNDGEFLEHMYKLAEISGLLAVHCENDAIVRKWTDKLITSGQVAGVDYPKGRPQIAEIEAVSRIAMFAELTRAKVNVAHCSTSRGVEIISLYKKRGTDITVETCPHYLMFSEDSLGKLGVYGVCNPPFRDAETIKELWKYVLNGEVDFVGSDHATYTFEEKEAGRENIFLAPAGVTGIQTCFPLFFDEAVNKRKMKVTEFVKMSSINAARRYGLSPQKGILQVGADGDIVIFDPGERWQISEEKLYYKQKWTPYMGMCIKGKVISTIVRGKVVYENGMIAAEAGYGEFVRPNNRKK